MDSTTPANFTPLTAIEENTKTITNKPIEVLEVKENNQNITENKNITNSIVNDNFQGKELQRIVLKKQYKLFLKLIKSNKFTTAMVTAKILGVTRQTIQEWLKTPLALRSMNETINNYISDISVSKDWKAKAYLLDKIEDKQDKQEQQIDLNQLIVINTK